jgi:superfamily II DNA or RNA helicase
MKIIVKNISSTIETDNPQLLEALYKLYTFKMPGAEYSTSYRSHHWDGNKHFITKLGSFKTGLLPRILKDLKKINCSPDLDFVTKDEKKVNDYVIPNYKFYDYQEDLIKKSLELKRGIIKSPTGSGKTLILAGLIQALHPRKMVVLFNSKQLLTQTYEFLKNEIGFTELGICFGEGYIHGNIMLCTVQSIEKIIDTHLESTEVLFVDECHEFSKGKTSVAAIESFPAATYRFGLTATPPSDDLRAYTLEGALGPIIQVVDTNTLVEDGHLTKPIIQLINRKYEASGLDVELSYREVYDAYIVNNESRNSIIVNVVENIKQSNPNAKILILTKSLEHGRSLESKINNAQFLEGADDIASRYKTINKFRSTKKASVLIGTNILQTGVNIKEITHFINARGLMSEIATLQALGRALRKHESKDKVYIYDFMDKEKYLLKHSKKRKQYYEDEGHEVVII